MSLEMWAVAAVAVVDAAGNPLILRTYTSPSKVLESPEAPQQAHLYVGPEDIVKIHFLLFSSLDRCEELWGASQQRFRAAAAAKQASSTLTSSGTSGSPATGTTPGAGGGGGAASTRAASVPGASAARLPVVAGTPIVDAPDVGRAAVQGKAVVVPTSSGATTVPAPPKPRLVTSTTDVRFMGKLTQGHRFLSYGLCSATGVKTVLVTVGCEAPQDAVLPLCRAIYEAASAALCNPFRTPDVCWRAQQVLLERGYRELLDYGEERQRQDQATGERESRGGRYRDSVIGMQEHSWPASKPSWYGTAHQPTLALSSAFNNQLRSILSTLTVTSQSCIMR